MGAQAAAGRVPDEVRRDLRLHAARPRLLARPAGQELVPDQDARRRVGVVPPAVKERALFFLLKDRRGRAARFYPSPPYTCPEGRRRRCPHVMAALIPRTATAPTR